MPLCVKLLFIADSHSKAAYADEFMFVVCDADVPNVAGAADMQGPGHRMYIAASYSPYMVGIDLHSYADLLCGIYDQRRSDAARCFCQGGGSASVKQAVRLYGTMIYRHH